MCYLCYIFLSNRKCLNELLIKFSLKFLPFADLRSHLDEFEDQGNEEGWIEGKEGLAALNGLQWKSVLISAKIYPKNH